MQSTNHKIKQININSLLPGRGELENNTHSLWTNEATTDTHTHKKAEHPSRSNTFMQISLGRVLLFSQSTLLATLEATCTMCAHRTLLLLPFSAYVVRCGVSPSGKVSRFQNHRASHRSFTSNLRKYDIEIFIFPCVVEDHADP